jgi:hypothetical protein
MPSPKIYQVANLQSTLTTTADSANNRVLKAGDTMTGNLNVAATLITQNVIPNANVTYDLGTSTARFKDLWLSNSTIYLGEASISAQGGNVSFGNAEIQLSNVSTKLNVTNDLFVSGNVGIGTASPSAKLSVDGSVVFNDSGADVDFRVEGDSDANLLFVDASTDRVGVGTNAPAAKFSILGPIGSLNDTAGTFRLSTDDSNSGIAGNRGAGLVFAQRYFTDDPTPIRVGGIYGVKTEANGNFGGGLAFYAQPASSADMSEIVRINMSGVGVGTTNPATSVAIAGSTATTLGFSISPNGWNNARHRLTVPTSGDTSVWSFNYNGSAIDSANYGTSAVSLSENKIIFSTGATNTAPSERARITSDGNLLVGTTTNAAKLTVDGNIQTIWGSNRISTNFDNNFRQGMYFDVTPRNLILFSTSNDSGGNILFSTRNANGSGDNDYGTERARITAGGNLLVGKTAADSATVGCELRGEGLAAFTRSGDFPVIVNRTTNDGTLVSLRQAGVEEGTISVSGATVSYNAFAGSHWSQLQDGSKPDILRGTVMESINELCVWEGEDNERLPKCKISDTAGSKKVYGVFMAWDNDWTETNDMYVTAVGAFICRVNAGITVQEGDLLESNGDGTARVQADDIIRSSTIGKVTSTVKTHEYDDGSYCVPTVLYCG